MGATNKISGSYLSRPVLQPPSGNQACVFQGQDHVVLYTPIHVENRPLGELSQGL